MQTRSELIYVRMHRAKQGDVVEGVPIYHIKKVHHIDLMLRRCT